MPSCAVATCENVYRKNVKGDSVEKTIHFHKFPKNEHRTKWLQACQRKDPVNVNYAVICSEHFSQADYKRNGLYEKYGIKTLPKLLPTAVPTLNLPDSRIQLNYSCATVENNEHGEVAGTVQRCDQVPERTIPVQEEPKDGDSQPMDDLKPIHCVVCYHHFEPNSVPVRRNIDDLDMPNIIIWSCWSREEFNLFRRFCKFLNVNLEDDVMMNAAQSPFPFCDSCKSQLEMLSAIRRTIDHLEKRLIRETGEIKVKAKACEEDFVLTDLYTQNQMYSIVRHQILIESVGNCVITDETKSSEQELESDIDQWNTDDDVNVHSGFNKDGTEESDQVCESVNVNRCKSNSGSDEHYGKLNACTAVTVSISAKEKAEADEYLLPKRAPTPQQVAAEAKALSDNFMAAWERLQKDDIPRLEARNQYKPTSSTSSSLPVKKQGEELTISDKSKASAKGKRIKIRLQGTKRSLVKDKSKAVGSKVTNVAKAETSSDSQILGWSEYRLRIDPNTKDISIGSFVFKKVGFDNYLCLTCSKVIKQKGKRNHKVRFHVYKVHSNLFVCNECGIRFHSRSHLNFHVKYKHKGINMYTRYNCEICKINFYNNNLRYERHQFFVHLSEQQRNEAIANGKVPPTYRHRVFQCEQCGRKFQSNSSLNRHKLNMHTDADDSVNTAREAHQ